jgi:hypothetical protein
VRTTVTLAPDVAAAVEERRRRRGVGISEVINELVRRGLSAPDAGERFRQRTSDMGPPRMTLDDVAGLLDMLEGDDRRS